MLYEYKCSECNSIEEKEHSMMESPVYTCPCGKEMFRRVTGGAAVFFKQPSGFSGPGMSPRGTGWSKPPANPADVKPMSKEERKIIEDKTLYKYMDNVSKAPKA